jgi:hypothetical protein
MSLSFTQAKRTSPVVCAGDWLNKPKKNTTNRIPKECLTALADLALQKFSVGISTLVAR